MKVKLKHTTQISLNQYGQTQKKCVNVLYSHKRTNPTKDQYIIHAGAGLFPYSIQTPGWLKIGQFHVFEYNLKSNLVACES